MAGFDGLWDHYMRSIDNVEYPQKCAWVLMTVLFLIKFFPLVLG